MAQSLFLLSFANIPKIVDGEVEVYLKVIVFDQLTVQCAFLPILQSKIENVDSVPGNSNTYVYSRRIDLCQDQYKNRILYQ